MKTFTDKIRRAFSDAADQYDILTSLHKEIGRELVKKTVRLNAPRILDVGCGTGYIANKAKFFFPESVIVGLDLAEGMLMKASEQHTGIAIDWVQADAQKLPFKDHSFDLILSNLSYQWVLDIQAAAREAARVLSTGGNFYITLFGSRTCQELFQSLHTVFPDMAIKALPTVAEIANALTQAGFKNIAIDYEIIKVEFRNVRELLEWLKAIGSNSLSDSNVFLGKEALANVDAHYRRHFPYNEGISTSFEVIWGHGGT